MARWPDMALLMSATAWGPKHFRIMYLIKSIIGQKCICEVVNGTMQLITSVIELVIRASLN